MALSDLTPSTFRAAFRFFDDAVTYFTWENSCCITCSTCLSERPLARFEIWTVAFFGAPLPQ